MKKNDEQVIVISTEKMKIARVAIPIQGDSPLITHKWSEKAKKEILDKQQKKANKGKEARDPVREFCRGLYILDEHGNLYEEMPEDVKALDMSCSMEEVNEVLSRYQFGFPTIAFKSAMLDTAYQQGLIAKKTTARGAVRILGEYAIIKGMPTIREDTVMIGGISKTADLRYRPEFKEWSTTLVIEYLENSVSAEQIFSWLEYGGFCCGVGEWRMSKDGGFGSFHPAPFE